MKTIIVLGLRVLLIACAIFTDNLLAAEGIAGEPKVKIPPEFVSVDEAKLSQELCGSGWKIASAGGPITKSNFLCVPVTPKVECPSDADLVKSDCSIGCRVRPK